jgi:hypothetical protein
VSLGGDDSERPKPWRSYTELDEPSAIAAVLEPELALADVVVAAGERRADRRRRIRAGVCPRSFMPSRIDAAAKADVSPAVNLV